MGVLSKRNAHLIAAMLGIVKAGGAYVPLDPAYPASRLAYILNDANASVLILGADISIELPKINAETLVLEELVRENPAAPKPDNPARNLVAETLAYIIYTSGSTGNPKGVAIRHRGAAVFLDWAHGAFTAEQMSGVLAATSICFDFSVFEIFAPLTCGGTAIFVENALQLLTLTERDRVTLINTVPSAMNEVLRLNGLPESVATVNLGGEAVPWELVRKLYKIDHVKEVFNLYGPTEDTVYSTYGLMDAEKPVTIGYPLSNSKTYLLDRNMAPVPVGVPGELFLSGDGLARGYHQRPDLTAWSYLPNPYSKKPGARLYRTGDLARYLPDGEVFYIGRIDHQVKLRGFRIELGEIESGLRRHPDMLETVVMVREDQPGNPC